MATLLSGNNTWIWQICIYRESDMSGKATFTYMAKRRLDLKTIQTKTKTLSDKQYSAPTDCSIFSFNLFCTQDIFCFYYNYAIADATVCDYRSSPPFPARVPQQIIAIAHRIHWTAMITYSSQFRPFRSSRNGLHPTAWFHLTIPRILLTTREIGSHVSAKRARFGI